MPPPRRARTNTATDALVSVAPPLTRWIERLLAGHDPPLTLAQYLALRAIADEGADSAEIARRTGVSGPAVSQLVASLSDKELIERAAVATDRRRQALIVSPTGRRALASAHALLRRRLSSLLAGVPPREADALARGLEAVEAALEGRPPPRRPPKHPKPPKHPNPPKPPKPPKRAARPRRPT